MILKDTLTNTAKPLTQFPKWRRFDVIVERVGNTKSEIVIGPTSAQRRQNLLTMPIMPTNTQRQPDDYGLSRRYLEQDKDQETFRTV